MESRYVTRDSNEAQYLIHRKHRCLVVIADDSRPVFSFVDLWRLREDLAGYAEGPMVSAPAFGTAGSILRKLVREARHRRVEWERMIAAAAGAATGASCQPAEDGQ